MVTTDLGRAYQTNFILTHSINLLMAVVAKSSEGGARTPVLAALTTADENGKYITHYQSDENYKRYETLLPFSLLPHITDMKNRRDAEKTVFGPTGQKMQAQVWGEVMGALAEKVPEVKSIANWAA